MRYLLLPAELQVREFWGRLLVALAAAEKGVWTLTGDQHLIRQGISYCRPGLMFLKDVVPYWLPWYQDLKEKGFRFCSMDEESLGAYQHPDFALNRFSDATVEMVDTFYCWGAVDYDVVTPHYAKYHSKFIKTGNPRFDLWRAPLRQIHQPKVDEIRAEHGEFILVPSNFSGLFHGMGRDFVLEQANKIGWLKDQQAIDNLVARMEHKERCRLRYVELIKELARERKVLLRPHPSENEQRWRDCFAGVDGVDVVHDGEIAPWILASQAVLHHGCSTGLEAALLGVPSVSYLPDRDPGYDGHLSLEVSWAVESMDEARQLLLSPGLGCAEPRVDLEAMLSLGDRLAFDQLADHLAPHCEIPGEPDLETELRVAFQASRDVRQIKDELNVSKAATRRAKERLKEAKEERDEARAATRQVKESLRKFRAEVQERNERRRRERSPMGLLRGLGRALNVVGKRPETVRAKQGSVGDAEPEGEEVLDSDVEGGRAEIRSDSPESEDARGGRISKWEPLPLAEVESFVREAGRLLGGRFENVAVTEICQNIFLIRPKRKP